MNNRVLALFVVILMFVAAIVYLGVVATFALDFKALSVGDKLLMTSPAWVLQIWAVVIAAKYL